MDPGAQTAMWRGLEFDVAAMAARHIASYRQAEADPAGGRVARCIEAHKRAEHAIPVCGRYPRSVVVDEDVDPVGDHDTGEPDMVAVAARIRDQISETTP